MRAFLRRLDERGSKAARPRRRELCRVASASRRRAPTIAEILLTMAIRAIDYTPPVHIEFSDYLSALLTADREVRADDSRYELRAGLLDCVRRITGSSPPPNDRRTGRWQPPGPAARPRRGAPRRACRTTRPRCSGSSGRTATPLKLDPEAYTRVASVRPVPARLARGRASTSARPWSSARSTCKIRAPSCDATASRKPAGMARRQDVVLEGGTTLILDEYGDLKYEVYNRVPIAGRTSADVATRAATPGLPVGARLLRRRARSRGRPSTVHRLPRADDAHGRAGGVVT